MKWLFAGQPGGVENRGHAVQRNQLAVEQHDRPVGRKRWQLGIAGSLTEQRFGSNQHGYEAIALDTDVTDADAVKSMVEHVTAELGAIDVLVNNAGISIGAPALETTDDAWNLVVDTNLTGVWRCCREVGKQMVARGTGSIINIGSMSAMIVNRPRWQPAYLASKAAVHQLTKALAAEWAPHGVRVNALAPGYILTEQSPVDQPEYQPWCVEPAAMRRYGLPEELGPATVFLASAASSLMTGSIIVIDAGYTLF